MGTRIIQMLRKRGFARIFFGTRIEEIKEIFIIFLLLLSSRYNFCIIAGAITQKPLEVTVVVD